MFGRGKSGQACPQGKRRNLNNQNLPDLTNIALALLIASPVIDHPSLIANELFNDYPLVGHWLGIGWGLIGHWVVIVADALVLYYIIRLSII